MRVQIISKEGKIMIAYSIDYTHKGRDYSALVDARDLKSAKRKLGRKHGYKTGNTIKINRVSVIGYY